MKLPSKEELHKAATKTLPDLLGANMTVLFVGINPGLYTAYSGFPYAHPANRFWPTMFASGFTPRLLKPSEYTEMLPLGYGMTNIVSRASANANKLSRQEYRDGGKVLVEKIEQYQPKWVAFVGIQAYRAAFNKPQAKTGMQEETLAGAKVWVLPSPSGLNAHYKPSDFADEFRALKNAIGM